MILKIINFFFLILLDLCKSILNLKKLNNDENKGKILKLTKLKFTPNTKITAPFNLGQSIRGLSFDKNLKKDLFANFINQIILNDVDKEKLINTLFSHLNEEKHLNAASTVGLKNNYKLAKYPAWSLVMPEKITIEKNLKTTKKNLLIIDQNITKISKIRIIYLMTIFFILMIMLNLSIVRANIY